MRPWKLVCYGALAVILSSAAADAQSLRTLPIHRRGIIADAVGARNFHAADVSGDGVVDIIACAGGAPFAQQYVNGAYSTFWQGPAVSCRGVAAGDVNGDGSTDIVVVTDPGSLFVFDARSAGAQVSVNILAPWMVEDVVVGNVDADAALEIVVVTRQNTFVYDGKTLSIDWAASGYGGGRAVLAQIDNDVQREIVVNGATGFVLDAAERKLEWEYSGGFGETMVAGNLDADAFSELVFGRGYMNSLTVLQTDAPGNSTVIPLETNSSAIGLGDRNGDGVDEILTAAESGDISGRDPVTGAKLWSITNPARSVTGVFTADVDGDGETEAVWGNRYPTTASALMVGSPATGKIEWRSVDLDGPFTSDGADLDLDGSAEWVVVSRGSSSGSSGSLMDVVDVRTGASRNSEPKAPSNTTTQITASAVGQLDTDPALEVALLSSGSYPGGPIVVLDGATLTEQWTSGGSFAGTWISTQNVDTDPWDEIIAVTTDGRVVVLDGASNIVQAIRSFGGVSAMIVADTDGVGVPEVIVSTDTKLSVLSLPSLTLRVEIAVASVMNLAASPVDGGTIAAAFRFGPRLRTFAASTLAPRWSCTALPNESLTALTFATTGSATALLAGSEAGLLRVFRFGGADCESAGEVQLAEVQFPSAGIRALKLRDVTRDGRDELLVEGSFSTEIVLMSLAGEARGEVDGNGIINEQDVSMLMNYVLGDGAGGTPAADVNRDGRIGVEDIFGLIDHVYAGGAAPQP